MAPPATQFFKYGPAQAFGADSTLKRGLRVEMVKHEFGYSQVRLTDGTTGYVATEDLKPAPPLPPPAPLPTLARNTHGFRSDVKPSNDPLFDITDIPLPLPAAPDAAPAAKPKPEKHE